MNKLRINSDNFISLSGPVRNDNGEAVSNSPTSVTARIYDERKENRIAPYKTRLSLEADSSSATEYFVPKTDPVVFLIGDKIRFISPLGVVSTEAGNTVASVNTANAGYNGLNFSGALSIGTLAAGSKVELRTYVTASTVLALASPARFSPGDTLEIVGDDGVRFERDVGYVRRVAETEDTANVLATAASSPDANTVVSLSSATDRAVSSGNRVRCKLGADVSMSAFGTFPAAADNPVAGDTSWGFRGQITDTHTGLVVGQDVRIEIEHIGDGFNVVDSIRAKVVESDA